MDCRSTSVSAPSHIHVGGGQTCEVLPSRRASGSAAGSTSRRPGGGQHLVAIPGYGGHVSGKAAENMHGSTFRYENQRADRHLAGRELRRTQSEPSVVPWASTESLGRSGSKALSTAPRIPGYTGCYPGKIAQIVHGVRFAEACEQAQVQRESNPSDRMHASQWSKRFTKANTSYLLTDEEDRQAREASQRLGCTFGLTQEKRMPFRQPWYGWPSAQPGSAGCPTSKASRSALGSPRTSDRLVNNSLNSNKAPKGEGPKAARTPPCGQPTVSAKLDQQRCRPPTGTSTPPCGQPTVSAKLDQQRWLLHNALLLGDGNQRTV